MSAIQSLMDSLFLPVDLSPMYSLVLIPLAGYLFFGSQSGKQESMRSTQSSGEDFEISIRRFPNRSVNIGLHISEHLSAEDVSRILMKALPVIGRYDRNIIRLLLIHCHKTLQEIE
ncbi:MAG: hypothetical protein AAFQ94_25150 [Bacteroidota bacterium]